MDASRIFETIALLIEQAERGEIDPWDVSVIDVIDRYLSELVPSSQATPSGYAADLSQSGQAFLSASMLVLFKANTLMQLQSAEDEPEIPEEELLTLGAEHLTSQGRLPFERQLRRRPAAKPPLARRVTLQELVEQLQVIATQLQQQEKVSKTPRSRHRHPSAQAMRAALELAHQENLTEVALELEELLQRLPIEPLPEQNWLNLEQLVQLWHQSKQASQNPSISEGEHNDKVSVFWALLLLCAQSKVELSQEEFYQEIKIRFLNDGEDTGTKAGAKE
jgi:segregation and condensation protein A